MVLEDGRFMAMASFVVLSWWRSSPVFVTVIDISPLLPPADAILTICGASFVVAAF